ncbi:DUF1642 domain-containing protein [Jeotgalibaca porci]|uniref:DUF1642 domain-containing protein n=1 Tax=Jeotgalibaca porci TaxID=1868793 RepID=UPI00359FB4CA
MNEQISTIQTREVLELMRNLAPILNQKELFEFMLFSNRVLERYMPEHYNDGLSEEETEMRKDKAWLKEEIWKQDIVMNKGYIYTDDLMSIINEVDEPEKPVIPQFVADWIEDYRDHGDNTIDILGSLTAVFNSSPIIDKKVIQWFKKNTDKMLNSLVHGYEVEKEPVYYAKIKGHELVETETILDDDTGNDVSEFHRNIYFVLQRNGELVIDMKDSGLSGAKHFMTMNQWNSLGINETNADFEEVAE